MKRHATPHPAAARRSTRRTFLAGSLAATGALSLAACGSSAGAGAEGDGASADHGTVDVNLSWIKNTEFAGEYFAIERGYFEDAGFSGVNLIAGGPSGTSTETMVLSGSALIGTSTPLGVAPLLQDEEAPLKIIGTTFQKNPFSIISLGAAPISTPQDIIGKRIGMQTGVNETLVEGFLTANGIEMSQIEVVPVQYDPQPLVNGEVDGFFGYVTNEALTLELAGEDVVNLPLADNGLPFMAGSLVVNQESIETQRETLKAFLAALIRGWTDAIAEPEEAAARLAVEEYGSDLGLDSAKENRQAQEQIGLVSTDETDASGLLTMSAELMQENVDALVQAGFDLSVEDCFDATLLEEVYAENPDLR